MEKSIINNLWREIILQIIFLSLLTGVFYFLTKFFYDQNMSHLKQQEGELKELFLSSQADLLQEIYRIESKRAVPVANSAEVDSKQYAAGERALYLGNIALVENNQDLAQFYFVNGLNHDPSNLKLVESLVQLAAQSKDNDLIQQTAGLLELSLFKVRADDVAWVAEKIALLHESIEVESFDYVTPEVAMALLEELVNDFSFEDMWHDLSALADFISKLEMLNDEVALATSVNSENEYLKVIEKVTNQLESIRNINRLAVLYSYASDVVAEINELLIQEKMTEELFVALSSSAQMTIEEIWQFAFDAPIHIKEKVYDLPTQLHEAKLDYLAQVAREYQAELDQLAVRFEKIKSINNQTKKIEEAQELLSDLLTLSNNVQDEAFQNQAIAINNSLVKLIEEAEVKRISKYQSWVANNMYGFIRDWNNITLRVNKEEAKDLSEKYSLPLVDQTLLIPEVAVLYQDALEKFYSKLGKDEQASTKYQFATGPKRKITEF